MKIKIGNFNFINDKENKLGDRRELQDGFCYFWIDGKENKLFVLDASKFELERPESSIPIFERQLMERFEIIPFYKMIKNEIDDYIKKKVENLVNTQNYSRYELYKDISLTDILNLKKNSEFKFPKGTYFVMNFDTNKIEINEFRYNPYAEKIDNIEECETSFKNIIKNNIILKEIEKGIAPKFVVEIMKIDDFLKDKKSCSLIFSGTDEKFPLKKPYTSSIINLVEDKITLGNYKDKFKIQDLRGLIYGKNFFEINVTNLMNISKQISISFEDRLQQRIDYLKNEIESEYTIYRAENERNYYDMPYSMNDIVKVMLDNDEDKPKWFTKEIKQMGYKYNLLNYLEEAQTIEKVETVCVELGDNELQNIYYGMCGKKENFEEDETEEI